MPTPQHFVYQDTNDFYFSIAPSYRPFGHGTAVNDVEPVLEGGGLPAMGQAITVRLSDAQAGARAHLLVGSAASFRELRGVWLVTWPDLGHQPAQVDGSGVAEVSAPLGSRMSGSTLFVQAVVESSAALSATGGLAFTVLP